MMFLRKLFRMGKGRDALVQTELTESSLLGIQAVADALFLRSSLFSQSKSLNSERPFHYPRFIEQFHFIKKSQKASKPKKALSKKPAKTPKKNMEKKSVMPQLAAGTRAMMSMPVMTVKDKTHDTTDEKDSLFRTVLIVALFAILVYAIVVIKIENVQSFRSDEWFFLAYSFAVATYVLSRFFLAYFYKPEAAITLADEDLPSVSFGIPCKNEEENICETIVRIASSDYPQEKFDIIVVNDGSTDGTLTEMYAGKKIAKEKHNIDVEVIDWKKNRGKREGMAETVKRSQREIMVFIDSDSFVQKDTVKNLVKYFVDPTIGAVAGQAYVANADKNFLTKMQEVRYFVAFKAYKSAEAIFGSVTCCSGCCAAYRRSYILPQMDAFLSQKFLGVQCTYGDDRSLTNIVLKDGYKAIFAPDAISHTFAPDNIREFITQQTRWKKSWTRESFKASLFIWKRHPIMAISHYLGLILPLVAPIVVVRALIFYPIEHGTPPYYYLSGLLIMSFVYGLYYYIYARDDKWIYGVVFSFFYTILLIWQLPWAIMNIRDPQWGTR